MSQPTTTIPNVEWAYGTDPTIGRWARATHEGWVMEVWSDGSGGWRWAAHTTDYSAGVQPFPAVEEDPSDAQDAVVAAVFGQERD